MNIFNGQDEFVLIVDEAKDEYTDSRHYIESGECLETESNTVVISGFAHKIKGKYYKIKSIVEVNYDGF
jgi:hypothetical protein